ncbi:MAG: polymer-forming cytoskeletal protein [bacterium]|nr:polymer-forming cytoskeletal protein [Gemmatimonadota bacterium]
MIGKKPGLGPDNGEATSMIGESSSFDGTLEVSGNLRVDGKFTGKIRVSETLVVGRNGLVDADVNTKCAVVAGTIKGNIHASEKITLQSGSRLEGEMVTSRLVIEEGVSFQGSCNTAQGAATGASSNGRSNAGGEDAKALQEKIEEVAEQLARK